MALYSVVFQDNKVYRSNIIDPDDESVSFKGWLLMIVTELRFNASCFSVGRGCLVVAPGFSMLSQMCCLLKAVRLNWRKQQGTWGAGLNR